MLVGSPLNGYFNIQPGFNASTYLLELPGDTILYKRRKWRRSMWWLIVIKLQCERLRNLFHYDRSGSRTQSRHDVETENGGW